MRRHHLYILLVGAIAVASFGHNGQSVGQLGGAAAQPKKFPDFDTVVKGAREIDGLFKLFRKDDQLYAEIRPAQFEQPFLCPIAIARGMGRGGETLNFGDQWVLVFRRQGDRVFLVRRNVRFHAKANAPIARAVETTYTDSVLLALPIRSIHPIRQGVLIGWCGMRGLVTLATAFALPADFPQRDLIVLTVFRDDKTTEMRVPLGRYDDLNQPPLLPSAMNMAWALRLQRLGLSRTALAPIAPRLAAAVWPERRSGSTVSR